MKRKTNVKRKPRKTRPLRLAWTRRTPSFHADIVRSDGLKCSIVTQEHKRMWHVLALTTGKETFDDALDDHAHKFIGSYETLGKAMMAGNSWAAHWLKGHKVANADKCLCREIT